jgi:hypothetical protein
MGLLINVAIQSIDNNQMLNDFSQSMPSSRDTSNAVFFNDFLIF